MRSAILSVLALFPLVCHVADGAETDWNQWRGPTRDAAIESRSWPPALEGHLKLVWERPHSPSYSGPIVCDDLVFTTETIGKTTERVTAYRLDSGDMAWQSEWPGAMAVPFFAAANGDWIRSTPACDGQHLIVLGMRDVLVSLNPQTGVEQWRTDFPTAMGTNLPAFGAVCSPVIDQGHVYVQTGGALVKVALDDGSVVWSTLENNSDMSSSGAFSSPVIETLGGVRQLVVQTRQELCGVDLETGNVLWREPIEAFRGMNILTPLVFDDHIFTAAHSGKAQLFAIQRSDTGQWSVTEDWVQKSQGYMSSPVLMDDSIYLHMRNQRVVSLGVGDGSIRWTSSPFGKYWSMIKNGSKILALDSSGELLLIDDSDARLKIVDKIQVASDSWAHLAIQGDKVIVRDLAALKVYQWK